MTDEPNDPRTDEMKREMAEHFDSFQYEYRDDDITASEIVYEDEDVAVVADHLGHELNEWADSHDVDRDELSEFFHAAARSLCEYDWSVSDPVLFDTQEADR